MGPNHNAFVPGHAFRQADSLHFFHIKMLNTSFLLECGSQGTSSVLETLSICRQSNVHKECVNCICTENSSINTVNIGSSSISLLEPTRQTWTCFSGNLLSCLTPLLERLLKLRLYLSNVYLQFQV